MSTLDDLRAARELVRKGWTQGRLHRTRAFRRDAYCVLGALKEATDCYPLPLSLAMSAVHAQIGPNIAGWNDNPRRRKSDVLFIFDQAIEAEEKEGKAEARAIQTRRWQSQLTPQTVTVNQVTDQEIEELFRVHTR